MLPISLRLDLEPSLEDVVVVVVVVAAAAAAAAVVSPLQYHPTVSGFYHKLVAESGFYHC